MSFTDNLKDHLKNKNIDLHNRWPDVIEQYEFLNLIGCGSFGRVFRAYCKRNRQQCAIKCISKQYQDLTKIASEVSIHIRLNHRNILQLYTVAEDSKQVHLVMEICRGGSLSRLISDQRHLSLKNDSFNPILKYEMISSIICQICDAFEYLHRNSIIHRDLNLNNILLVEPFKAEDTSLRIKIADFGLAIDQNCDPFSQNKIIGDTVCGTPGFIPPEVWSQNQLATPKSDIFSMGAILYACCTGNAPTKNLHNKSLVPMVSDLVSQLMRDKPEERPNLEEISQHIFVLGKIRTNNVFPIDKETKILRMAIDTNGNVEMIFKKDGLSIKVIENGTRINISQNGKIQLYDFFQLPEKYWKRYLYVMRFVNLVKAKTSKITMHCSEWFKKNHKDKESIDKCVLMADGSFEITFHNATLKDTERISAKNVSIPGLTTKYERMIEKIQDIEEYFERIGKELGFNPFPLTIGVDSKMLEEFRDLNISEEESFFTTSQVSRSFQIDGIGTATQFTNGSLQVNFNDGSDLFMDHEEQIFYLENGIVKKFIKDQTIPDVVMRKIALLPQVIKQMRERDRLINF